MNVLYEMADNYYVGRSGYLRNYTKAMQLYQKLSDHKHKPSTSMLGMGYFKGQGVPLNRTIAHKLFEQSKDTDQSAYMLTAMKYFGLETKKGKEEALK